MNEVYPPSVVREGGGLRTTIRLTARKLLFDILPSIQHTQDFRRVSDNTIEDDVRRGGE